MLTELAGFSIKLKTSAEHKLTKKREEVKQPLHQTIAGIQPMHHHMNRRYHHLGDDTRYYMSRTGIHHSRNQHQPQLSQRQAFLQVPVQTSVLFCEESTTEVTGF